MARLGYRLSLVVVLAGMLVIGKGHLREAWAGAPPFSIAGTIWSTGGIDKFKVSWAGTLLDSVSPVLWVYPNGTWEATEEAEEYTVWYGSGLWGGNSKTNWFTFDSPSYDRALQDELVALLREEEPNASVVITIYKAKVKAKIKYKVGTTPLLKLTIQWSAVLYFSNTTKFDDRVYRLSRTTKTTGQLWGYME